MSPECICRRAEMTDEEQGGERQGSRDLQTLCCPGPGRRNLAKAPPSQDNALLPYCRKATGIHCGATPNGRYPLKIHRLTRQ